ADILWQNSDGTPGVWVMNGTTIVNAVALPNPGANWKLVGAGNFYGAGDNDLVFVNTVTQQTQLWVMNGTQVSSIQTPGNGGAAAATAAGLAAPPSGSSVATVADPYPGVAGRQPLFGQT
ncbi:MAG TPA: hypothetical protein VEK73_03775, partial [Xanthobacteraceae bacterium]|nr:hypothetical protein [Xanthobacteraceae bacterium]